MHCSYNGQVIYAAVSLCLNGRRQAEQCVLCVQTTSIGFLRGGNMTENPCKHSGLQGPGLLRLAGEQEAQHRDAFVQLI